LATEAQRPRCPARGRDPRHPAPAPFAQPGRADVRVTAAFSSAMRADTGPSTTRAQSYPSVERRLCPDALGRAALQAVVVPCGDLVDVVAHDPLARIGARVEPAHPAHGDARVRRHVLRQPPHPAGPGRRHASSRGESLAPQVRRSYRVRQPRDRGEGEARTDPRRRGAGGGGRLSGAWGAASGTWGSVGGAGGLSPPEQLVRSADPLTDERGIPALGPRLPLYSSVSADRGGREAVITCRCAVPAPRGRSSLLDVGQAPLQRDCPTSVWLHVEIRTVRASMSCLPAPRTPWGESRPPQAKEGAPSLFPAHPRSRVTPRDSRSRLRLDEST